jgi:hypothetical protein
MGLMMSSISLAGRRVMEGIIPVMRSEDAVSDAG